MAANSQSKRQRFLLIAIPCVVVIGGFGTTFGYVNASCLITRSYELPPNVQNFEQFLAFAGDPNSVALLQNDHFEVTRQVPMWQMLITIPSSPPGYIFNDEGRLVDWSPDPGDDGQFQKRWPPMKRIVTVAEAQQMMEAAQLKQ